MPEGKHLLMFIHFPSQRNGLIERRGGRCSCCEKWHKKRGRSVERRTKGGEASEGSSGAAEREAERTNGLG